MIRTVHVRAPCRLHFGMFSFGHADRSQFGGVGLMIDPPAVEITISPAPRFHAAGSLAERAALFAELAVCRWQLAELPACEVVVRSPADHTGLGVGTQLALSVAAGLRRFLGLTDLPIEVLASQFCRGKRSSVGMYGFQLGGLIVDAGHSTPEDVGFLVARRRVPDAWRFVLVTPPNERGLAGDAESDAFAQLPPVPQKVTDRLLNIALVDMVPALEKGDYSAFGDAVYRFGRLAGECFAAVQGGPFASRQITELIQRIRNDGIAGVGQSSWGPTVFAICCSESDAQFLSERLQARSALRDHEIRIALPANGGAQIAVQAD
jgi:beta-RFAP synthase